MLIATAIEPRALLGFAAAPGAVAALAVLVAAFSRPGASRMAG
jgi:hypothetical protein